MLCLPGLHFLIVSSTMLFCTYHGTRGTIIPLLATPLSNVVEMLWMTWHCMHTPAYAPATVQQRSTLPQWGIQPQ